MYNRIQWKTPDTKDTGSSVSKSHHVTSSRGSPRRRSLSPVPQVVLDEARGELRNVMLQYTTCADPTESAARKERVRQAEEQGQMEESALQMARNSVFAYKQRRVSAPEILSPERIPASQRLGSPRPSNLESRDEVIQNQDMSPHVRVPATLRLGPSPPTLHATVQEGDELHQLSNTERLPATLRLGPVLVPEAVLETANETSERKRKPGRPPGKRKAKETQSSAAVPTVRRRKVSQKPSPVSRKTVSQTATDKARTTIGPSRGRQQTSSTTSSDNRPICNMIPATVRKRMDFRIQSTPGP